MRDELFIPTVEAPLTATISSPHLEERKHTAVMRRAALNQAEREREKEEEEERERERERET